MKNEIFLGNFELNEAKTLKIRLEALQVQTEIRANEHTCKTGNCKITVELWGLEEDKDKILELFRKDFFKNLGHSQVNFEALNSVYDPQSASVICQACGFKFSPENAECPDCGLSYR